MNQAQLPIEPGENLPAEKQQNLPTQPETPLQLMRYALDTGNVDALEKLAAMQEHFEDREAKKAFTVALSRFISDCPPLYRIKDGLRTKPENGGKVVNRYSPLDYIIRTIKPTAQDCGLSWRWRTEPQDGGKTLVTFVLMHIQGHSEETSMLAHPVGTQLTNAAQKDAAGVTYAKRYTMLAGLGLEQEGEDTDGSNPNDLLPNDLLDHYTKLIRELDMDEAGICRYLGIGSLPDLTVAHIKKLDSAVAAKRRSLAKRSAS